jgi:hypothetical protein
MQLVDKATEPRGYVRVDLAERLGRYSDQTAQELKTLIEAKLAGQPAEAVAPPSPRKAAEPIPPRAGNVSMCTDELKLALGYEPFRPWPANEALLPIHTDWHRTRDTGEIGSVQQIQEVLYRYPENCDAKGSNSPHAGSSRSGPNPAGRSIGRWLEPWTD